MCPPYVGEAAAFIPGYECNYLSVVAPSNFDRLISGCRTNQTALFGDSDCTGCYVDACYTWVFAHVLAFFRAWRIMSHTIRKLFVAKNGFPATVALTPLLLFLKLSHTIREICPQKHGCSPKRVTLLENTHPILFPSSLSPRTGFQLLWR